MVGSGTPLPTNSKLFIRFSPCRWSLASFSLRQLPGGAHEVTGVAARKTLQIILVLRLRLPEIPDGDNLRCGRIWPYAGCIHVRDRILGRALLIGAREENGRPVAQATIVSLTV